MILILWLLKEAVVNFIRGNFRDSKQALLLVWIHIRYEHKRIK